MSHERDRERTELLFHDELTETERESAEAHLRSCEECRALLDELKGLHGVLEQYAPLAESPELLADARARLHSALRDVNSSVSWTGRFREFIAGQLEPRYALAFGAVATVAVGFFLGYLAFHSGIPAQRREEAELRPAVSETRPAFPEGGAITNVKFIDSDAGDGEVEFTFDAVMPMHLKGRANDPQIQQVLSYALLNEQNPGVRLRTVNAMASEPLNRPDEEVKRVLIAALKSDENAGVRKDALTALKRYSFDSDIRTALMDALAHDPNPAIRIEAINALDSGRRKGTAIDPSLREILKERVNSDVNQYIRIRAKAVLQETNQ